MSQDVQVHTFEDRVEKTHVSRYLFTQELIGYANCHWISPKILGVDMASKTIVIERCVPLTQLPPNLDHARQAWDRLQQLHESGWNHRDCSVLNMVLHPTRGVLLIDWETVWQVPDVTNSLSYDLHGASYTDVPADWVPIWVQPEGIWWGAGRPHDPGRWWGVDFSKHNPVR